MSTSEKYQYLPIGADQIRLLQILHSFHENDPVSCTLTSHMREAFPKYEALSYTWGDLNNVKEILCNARPMKVTANCHAALIALRRRRAMATAPRTERFSLVWIDAICVDQENHAEKNVQVAQMGSIYGQAARTLIYLSNFNNILRSRPQDSLASEVDVNNVADVLESVLHETFDLQVDHVQDVAIGMLLRHGNQFFEDPWFTRTWIVQEVMLSRQIAWVFGLLDIPWETLRNILCTNGLGGTRRKGQLENMVLNTLYERFSESSDGRKSTSTSLAVELPQIVSIRMNIGLVHGGRSDSGQMQRLQNQDASEPTEYQSGLKLWRLLPLLKSTYHFQCRDPRDKLFGLVSLFEKPLPALLAPNYSKPFEEVFTDLSWFMIQYDTPEVLRMGGLEQSQNLMPSWVVNWTISREIKDDTSSKNMAEDSSGAGFLPGHKRMVVERVDNAIILRGVIIRFIWPTDIGLTNVSQGHEMECIAVFLGVREVYRLRGFEDGWKLVGVYEAPHLMSGEAVKDLDWDNVDSDTPVSPLHDFRIY